MKKRLLSALLALALVFVLLPTTALADTTPVTDENVKINGTAVIVGNDISLGDGNGTYSYDKSTRTLTLNNATITATGSNIGIDFCDTTNYVTYSVILTGENTVTSNNIAIETTPNTNLTFTGGGNLKAITNGYYQAIRVYGTLTIENSTLIAESSAYTATTVIWTLAMTGNNAKLEISNKSAANIVAGTAGPASKNIDWSNYQFTTGSYSGDALTESDPEVCSWGTLNEYLGFPTKKYSQYICIAKRTIPALTKTSDVFIAGEKAVVSQWTNIPADTGTGSYSYDADKKELTLKDVNITSGINAIQFMANGAYTIKLEGENKISNVSNGISLSDDQYITSLNVTITGTGSLDISAKGLAINMKKGDLKFENTGAIKLATSSIELNNNALSVKGNITITDMSKYSVTGTQQTGGKPLGSEVSLTEASQLKGGTTGYRIITITRGDEVARTESPVVIDGHTLLNDTYYTINGSTVVANGSESNYNAFYDSETKTLKLNNAKISTTTGTAIKIEEDLTITVTGTNELNGNYNHCIESDNNFKINGTGRLVMTNGSNTDASVIYCGPGKSLTIAAEVIIKNAAQPGKLIHTVKDDAYSFAEGYNVYASTDVSGSPLEVYNPENYGNYKYLRVTKENLAPTTPTTYTVTITAGDNMKRESGALTQEVTKGAAITEVKFMAASGHYFPADYVSKMNLPAGLTAEIRENSWYLIISGTPTSDVTINLPAASVRPTITVSMPTPVAGNTPATASDITLTYSDINKSISKNLTISNVVWQSYVPNGDGSITPGEALSSGDKFEAGKTYFVRITHEYVAGDYDIVPAAGITLDYTESDSTYMMLLFYTTGAPCNHEYTNDWLANGNTHWHECKLCRAHAGEVAHTFGDWITDTPATDTTDGSKHRTCSVCQYQENATIPKTGTGEIVPPTPDNPGTVIIRPAEEEKPAQQPNPSTGANDLVGMAVAAAVVAVLGSVALLRKHD